MSAKGGGFTHSARPATASVYFEPPILAKAKLSRSVCRISKRIFQKRNVLLSSPSALVSRSRATLQIFRERVHSSERGKTRDLEFSFGARVFSPQSRSVSLAANVCEVVRGSFSSVCVGVVEFFRGLLQGEKGSILRQFDLSASAKEKKSRRWENLEQTRFCSEKIILKTELAVVG